MSNNVVLLKLQLFTVGYVSEDLEEKKLLGSGGYAFAKLTEQEEVKASLGVPQIFLGNVGRLNEYTHSSTIKKMLDIANPVITKSE